MKKKFSLVTFMVLVFFSTVYPQWTYEGAWPDTNYKGGTHGIAVDPDGKVWTASYYPSNWVSPSGDTLSLRPLYVFNPDGSLLEIIGIVTGAGGTDTLARGTANCRGIRADQDGNILYVSAGPSKMIKINYQTRQRMASVLIPETGSSPTAPGVSDDGTIYVGPVVGGGTTAIATYGTDLGYLGNAVTGPANIARTMTVSPDGLSIYWTMFTGAMGIDIYTRPDELGSFALSDSAFRGMSIETVDWNPATGNLWISNDSRGTGGYSHLAWYGVDVTSKKIVDGFILPSPDPVPADEFPRGLAFSPDGNTAYVGLFGTKYDRLYKFTKSADTTVDVTFAVDMGVQAFKGKFNPATDTLKISGNFNGWNQYADVMTDLDGDTIYTVTKSLTSGFDLFFKFVNTGKAQNTGYEDDPNRLYTVPFWNSVYDDYFDRDSSYFIQVETPVQVTFACDMEFEIESGRFNPATDTLSARGNFNGWSSTWVMAPSVGDPLIYEVTKTDTTFAGDTYNYKYAYITGSGTTWEGDPNNVYTVTGDDITTGFAYVARRFNNLTLDNVTNAPCTIKFTVNMADARSAINLQLLAPVTDVRLCGANPPLRWPAGGWPNADSALTIKCYDDGTNGDVTAGDNIWSRDVVFAKYSPLHVQYKYGANWGLSTNQGGNDNENGVGADHFINLTSAMISATVVNVFGTMGDHTLENIVLDVVSELPGLPVSYNLAQNFPNPFNPSTSIRFSIPEAGLVTLRVFNLLGEEVATLLNEYKNTGNYDVQFDASRLTTGVYFYTISVNNFTSTKKMVLTK